MKPDEMITGLEQLLEAISRNPSEAIEWKDHLVHAKEFIQRARLSEREPGKKVLCSKCSWEGSHDELLVWRREDIPDPWEDPGNLYYSCPRCGAKGDESLNSIQGSFW